MSLVSLVAAATDAGSSPALIVGDRCWSWAELAELARGGQPRPRLALRSARVDAQEVASALATFDDPADVLVPLHPNTPASRRAELEAALAANRDTLPASAAAVLFTSGTSGVVKGVMHSRAAFEASAHAGFERIPFHPGDRWLTPLSWSTIGGLSVLTRAVVARACAELIAEPSGSALRRSIDRGATHVSLVPVLLRTLLDDPHWYPPAHLRAVLVGGAALDADLAAAARRRGVPIAITYGMTETCAQVATSAPGDEALRLLPGVRARARGGAIELSGPTLMLGYLGGELRDPDGWFATGDVGSVQTGLVEIRGRADGRISSAGARVDPQRVEEVLRKHCSVSEACVHGLPDPTWGELVAAVIALEPSLNSDSVLPALTEYLQQTLMSPERPRRVRFVPRLPRNLSGKIERALLAASGADESWLHLSYR